MTMQFRQATIKDLEAMRILAMRFRGRYESKLLPEDWLKLSVNLGGNKYWLYTMPLV
jgi:hypothetical protein